MSANLSPLAQTFKISSDFLQGCAITSVDLFFVTKDSIHPVEVQIVETLNGYPTNNVLAAAKALVYPADINISDVKPVATKFKFPSFVWLAGNTEYAIKVITNGQAYRVWTAVIGDRQIDNASIIISQQPALGSFFKSQNNSTWTPEQLQDLTFVLNRAKFNKNIIGEVNLVEAPISEYYVLPPNPFALTNGQTKVKVRHDNHGFVGGSIVRYVDSTDTQFNGVTFTIARIINSNQYVINTAAAQTSTISVGGGDVKSEKNVRFDALKIDGINDPSGSSSRISTRMSAGGAVDTSNTNLGTDDVMVLGTTKYIHNSINRSARLAGVSSFTFKNFLSTSNDAISPGFIVNNVSVHLMANKINYPSINDVDYAIDGEAILSGATVSYSASTATADAYITVPSTTNYARIRLGAQIKILAGTLGTGSANIGWVGFVTSINTTSNFIYVRPNDATLPLLVGATITAATVNQYTSFVSEQFNGGSAEAKHLTKIVSVTRDCTGMRIMVKMNIPAACDVQLWYRTGVKTPSVKLADSAWTNALITYKKSATNTEFTEYEYNVTSLKQFNEFQAKFVMLSTDYAKTPKLKDLRIIAHA